MKLREAENRLSKNLVGTVFIIPNDGRSEFGGKEMYLRFYSSGTAWLRKENTENAKIFLINAPDILDWEVSIDKNFIILDGYKVKVDGTIYGLSNYEEAVVEYVSEGDADVYPIKVRFKNGIKGQYRMEEIFSLRRG